MEPVARQTRRYQEVRLLLFAYNGGAHRGLQKQMKNDSNLNFNTPLTAAEIKEINMTRQKIKNPVLNSVTFSPNWKECFSACSNFTIAECFFFFLL
jgi:hypothetical protein